MYCKKCGTKLDNKQKYCSNCGDFIQNDFIKKETTNNTFTKPTNKKVKHKAEPVFYVLMFASVIVMVIVIFSWQPSIQINQETTPPTITSTPTTTIRTENINTCRRIAEEYYNTHSYLSGNVYDCDDMSCDVWNILETEGIEADIMMGNLEEDIFSDDMKRLHEQIELSNHVWVMAEITPNVFLPIECTSGNIKQFDDDYYHGIWFDTPKEYREFSLLSAFYLTQMRSVDYKTFSYNDMVSQYNDMNYISQITNKNALEVYKRELDKEKSELITLGDELKELIKE